MHFDRNPFTWSCEWGESLNNFKLGIFIGRFPSDGAANKIMAAKGLIRHTWEARDIDYTSVERQGAQTAEPKQAVQWLRFTKPFAVMLHFDVFSLLCLSVSLGTGW